MQNNPKLFANTCKNSQTDEGQSGNQSLVVNKNNFQKTFDKRSQNCVINYSYQVERTQFRQNVTLKIGGGSSSKSKTQIKFGRTRSNSIKESSLYPHQSATLSNLSHNDIIQPFKKEECTLSSSSNESRANLNSKLNKKNNQNQQTEKYNHDLYLKFKESVRVSYANMTSNRENTIQSLYNIYDSSTTPIIQPDFVSASRNGNNQHQVESQSYDDIQAEDESTPTVGRVMRFDKENIQSRAPLMSGVCFSGMPSTSRKRSAFDSSKIKKYSNLNFQFHSPKLYFQKNQCKPSVSNLENKAQLIHQQFIDYSTCCEKNLKQLNQTNNYIDTISLYQDPLSYHDKQQIFNKSQGKFPFELRSKAKENIRWNFYGKDGISYRSCDNRTIRPSSSQRSNQVSLSEKMVNQSKLIHHFKSILQQQFSEYRNNLEQDQNIKLIKENFLESQRLGRRFQKQKNNSSIIRVTTKDSRKNSSMANNCSQNNQQSQYCTQPQQTSCSVIQNNQIDMLQALRDNQLKDQVSRSLQTEQLNLPNDVTFCKKYENSVNFQKIDILSKMGFSSNEKNDFNFRGSAQINKFSSPKFYKQNILTEQSSTSNYLLNNSNFVYYSAYDDDLLIQRFQKKYESLELGDAINSPFEFNQDFQICFDTALSDYPFLRDFKEPSPQGKFLQNNQQENLLNKFNSIKVRLYKMTVKQMVQLLKLKGLDIKSDNSEMDSVKIEIIENNIYMKWILSQQGVQILKKYKILLEKRNTQQEIDSSDEDFVDQEILDTLVSKEINYLNYNCMRCIQTHQGIPVYAITNDQSQLPLTVPIGEDINQLQDILDILNRYQLFTRIRQRAGAPTPQTIQQIKSNHQNILKHIIDGLLQTFDQKYSPLQVQEYVQKFIGVQQINLGNKISVPEQKDINETAPQKLMGFKKNKKELLKCIKDDKISIGNSNKNSMIIVNVLNSETELYDNQSNPLVTKNSKNSNNEAKKSSQNKYRTQQDSGLTKIDFDISSSVKSGLNDTKLTQSNQNKSINSQQKINENSNQIMSENKISMKSSRSSVNKKKPQKQNVKKPRKEMNKFQTKNNNVFDEKFSMEKYQLINKQSISAFRSIEQAQQDREIVINDLLNTEKSSQVYEEKNFIQNVRINDIYDLQNELNNRLISSQSHTNQDFSENNKNNEIHDLSKSLFNSYMIKDKQNQLLNQKNSFQDLQQIQLTSNPCNYTEEKIYILNRFDDKLFNDKNGSRLTSRPQTIGSSSLKNKQFESNISQNTDSYYPLILGASQSNEKLKTNRNLKKKITHHSKNLSSCGINGVNKSMKLRACLKINGDDFSPEAESESEIIHKKCESYDKQILKQKSTILVEDNNLSKDQQSFESIITSKQQPISSNQSSYNQQELMKLIQILNDLQNQKPLSQVKEFEDKKDSQKSRSQSTKSSIYKIEDKKLYEQALNRLEYIVQNLKQDYSEKYQGSLAEEENFTECDENKKLIQYVEGKQNEKLNLHLKQKSCQMQNMDMCASVRVEDVSYNELNEHLQSNVALLRKLSTFKNSLKYDESNQPSQRKLQIQNVSQLKITKTWTNLKSNNSSNKRS